LAQYEEPVHSPPFRRHPHARPLPTSRPDRAHGVRRRLRSPDHCAATGIVTLSTGSASFTINDYVSATGFGFVGLITTNPTTTLTFTFAKTGTIVNEIFQVYNPAYANGSVVTTPAQKIGDLRAQIGALGLAAGIATSLDVKLRDALAAIGASNTALACTALQELAGQVNALSGKKLSAADAAAILSAIGTIRGQLGC
jgi:hypothetical protein